MRIQSDLFRRAALTTPQETADYFSRSIKTAERWHRTRAVPVDVGKLLNIRAGQMPYPGFAGFECIRGAIYAPGYADGVTADNIAAYTLKLHGLDYLRREIERYRAAPAQYLLDLDR